MLHAEVIAIGSELVSGRSLDTNSGFLSRRLVGVGIQLRQVTVVEDDLERIVQALESSLARADVVFTSGGLGPTLDDLTRQAILRVSGVRTRKERRVLASIRQRYRARGLKMPLSDTCMAEVPRGATVFPNPVGAAPGFALPMTVPDGRRWLIALPGPPKELQAVVDRGALPFLRRQYPRQDCLYTGVVRTTGLVESYVHRRIARYMRAVPPVSVGIYAKPAGVDVVVTATGRSLRAAKRRAVPIVTAVASRVGRFVYATSDEELEAVVGRRLAARGLTISVAESCTGGLITHRLTNVPGSSTYVRESVVVYSNEAKSRRLGVPAVTLAQHGAVSRATVLAMARGVRLSGASDLGLAVTGIAGPTGGSPDKPVGTVWIGLSHQRGAVARRHQFRGDRETVKWRSSQAALALLWQWITSARS